MTTTPQEFQRLLDAEPTQAWSWLKARALEICQEPLEPSQIRGIEQREIAIGELDQWLASCAWELWSSVETECESTADRLRKDWQSKPSGRAVLILDGLSLRELPWLLAGARQHGFGAKVDATRAELPPETNAFARAIGVGQRSSLQNNGLGSGVDTGIPGARTETTDMPFGDCMALIDSHPDWLFWHHWPDSRLHEHDNPGRGLGTLQAECAEQLASLEFWSLVRRLSQGRTLVVTSDHGYAATGLFHDAEGEQKEFLKDQFKSQRFAKGSGDEDPFVPPVSIALDTAHGPHRFCLGRRKWKNQGGFPTLAHGGLSLLEVFVPWVEFSTPAAA